MKKNMSRIIALLLALVLVLSIIPMAAMAATGDKEEPAKIKDTTNTVFSQHKDGSFTFVTTYKGGNVVTDGSGKVLSCSDGTYKVGSYVDLDLEGAYFINGKNHTHSMGPRFNRDGHFTGCSCGARGLVTPHIDPADAVNGRCTCGYKFMTNAQITTLWMSGVTLSPRFNKDKTEYTGKLTRDIDEITKYTVRTFDAKATVEVPESLKLKQGENKLQFTVTAEDGKTTQTYTIVITKD